MCRSTITQTSIQIATLFPRYTNWYKNIKRNELKLIWKCFKRSIYCTEKKKKNINSQWWPFLSRDFKSWRAKRWLRQIRRQHYLWRNKRMPRTKKRSIYIISIINISNRRLKAATPSPPVAVKILTRANFPLEVISKVTIVITTKLKIMSYWLSMRVKRKLNRKGKKIVKTEQENTMKTRACGWVKLKRWNSCLILELCWIDVTWKKRMLNKYTSSWSRFQLYRISLET